MKILHVFDHSIPIQDGYATRSRCILKQQQAFGWQTSHLTGPKQGQYKDDVETVSGIKFYRTKAGETILHRLPIVQQLGTISDIYKRLLTVIDTEKPQIIHAHSPALNGVAAALASKKTGIPFVYEIRAFWEDAAVDQGTTKEGDLRYRLTRAMENWVIKRASAVFTICKGLKDDLVSRHATTAPIEVIPNAVELEHISKPLPYQTDIAKKFGLTPGKTLGFIGSFYDYEGLDLLINATPELIKWDSDIRLLLVGGGNEFDNLQAQAKQLGLEDKIFFTGKVPYEEVTKYYSVIDVLVYPRKSLRLTELVTPLKPLEAMAQEKLFIASDVGGHKELVIPDETGVLFKADDAKDLIRNVEKILGDKALQAKMLVNGKKFVMEERNWGVSVGRYESLYSTITSR